MIRDFKGENLRREEGKRAGRMDENGKGEKRRKKKKKGKGKERENNRAKIPDLRNSGFT